MDKSYPRKLFTSSRHDSAKERLKWSLEHLQKNIDRALKALDAGESLDEHLITNAAPTTRDISVYNLTLDLKAFEDSEETSKEE